jgi:hypothetical protein
MFLSLLLPANYLGLNTGIMVWELELAEIKIIMQYKSVHVLNYCYTDAPSGAMMS